MRVSDETIKWELSQWPDNTSVHHIIKELQELRALLPEIRDALKRYKGLCVHWDENHHETCGRPADEALALIDDFMEEKK